MKFYLSYVPRALEALDRDEMVCNAYMLQQQQEPENDNNEDIDLNSFSYNKPRMNTRPNRSFKPNQQRNQAKKFCKVCQALEMPTYIINSHNPSDCRKKHMLQQIAIDDAEIQQNPEQD